MSELLKNKIQNHEVLPPPGVWKNIASELMDTNNYLNVSRKMYDFELTPPASAWSNITESLKDTATDRGIAPVKRMNSLFAAAAVFVGVILLGSLFFLNNNNLPEKNMSSILDAIGKPDLKPINLSASIKVLNHPPIQPSRPQQFAINTETENRINDYEIHYSRPLRKVAINASFTSPAGISVTTKPIYNKNGQIIFYPKIVLSDDGEHIDITAPNGQQTRISSKFMNVLLYMNGNNDPEYKDSEAWQKKFEELRNKIMQHSFIPSSTNFLDIIELKDLLTKDGIVD